MAQYSNLKAYIEEKIYENGTQAITGDILQDVLKVMTDDLGEFYQMGGVASPSTDPGTPDAKVIYFATEAGTYTNFGGITLAAGEVALLIFETSWTKETLNVLSSANGGVKTANLADGAVTTEKIAGGAVETAKIANNAVTSGKVADGAIGTAKIADGAIDADKIAANAVESAKIKNGAVTEGKINDGAVTAGKVAANAVTTAKIADDAVTTAKLNDGAVTEDKIATDAVTSGKVKDGAIGTAKIAAGAVTHAKIGAGAVEESNIKDGAVTSDKIANGAVGSDQLAEGAFSAENLADGSVTTDKLADGAVTAEKIADGAVTADKFANGSVTTIKLGSGAVTTEKIGDGMVTRQKLADSSVGTSKIIDGAVTTDKVADGAITDAKLENPVSVSQNTETGHIEITIGNETKEVASGEEVKKIESGLTNIEFGNNAFIDTHGEIVAIADNWVCSDYISVKAGWKCSGKIGGSSDACSVAFYDKEQNFISGISTEDFKTIDLDIFIPDNGTAFVRFCTYFSSASDKLQKWATIFHYFALDYEQLFRRIMLKTVPNIKGWISPTGVFSSTPYITDWYSTDYLDCYEGCLINYNSQGAPSVTLLLAFYDVNKKFISGIAPTETYNWEKDLIQAPANVRYVRLCTHSNSDPASDPKSYLHSYIYTQTYPMDENPYYGKLKYGANLRPINYNNKSIMFFGDSITFGVSSLAPSTEYPYGLKTLTDTCYAKLLYNLLGCNGYTNKAISGSSFVDGGLQIETITTTITNTSDNVDVIYIAGGTNDFQLQTPLGDIDSVGVTTFYGALKYVCDYLKLTYPDATIIFATPINYSKTKDTPIYKLNEYRNAIFEVAMMYGFMVVDCSEIGLPIVLSGDGHGIYKRALCYDGVHPTELGHKLMADNLAKMLL